MVSNDPHYPLEIATNSEIRRVFILDRFGWHTFILIISMNGISATLCRLLGNHPWHSLDPRTQYLWARTTLIIINLFCFPRLHLYMPSIYWLATETEKNILREQEWRQTDRSEWKSVPPPPSTQQDPRCLPGGDQDICTCFHFNTVSKLLTNLTGIDLAAVKTSTEHVLSDLRRSVAGAGRQC